MNFIGWNKDKNRMQLKTEAFDFTFAKILSFRTFLDKLYDTTTRILNESMDDYFWLVSILLATYDHPLNKKIKTVSNQIAQESGPFGTLNLWC